jgi:hypothetical protein
MATSESYTLRMDQKQHVVVNVYTSWIHVMLRVVWTLSKHTRTEGVKSRDVCSFKKKGGRGITDRPASVVPLLPYDNRPSPPILHSEDA